MLYEDYLTKECNNQYPPLAGWCNNDDGSEILIIDCNTAQIAPAEGDHITAWRGLRYRQKETGQVRSEGDLIMEWASRAGPGKLY